MNEKELLKKMVEHLSKALDILEEIYPKYYSSDWIAEVNDDLKTYDNKKE